MKVRLRGVTPSRFAAGIATLAAWSWLMVLIGRSESSGAAFVAAIFFTVPLCSLGEWLIHGVLYHAHLPGLGTIRRIHHDGHHFSLFPPKHYVDPDGRYEFMRFREPLTPWRMADNGLDNFLTKWSQVALHFLTGIPLILWPAWALTGNPAFGAGALATLAVISWLLAHVHGAIHTPRDRWVERQAWFHWLDRHHYIHHVDITSNINFMLPVCDFLFGTQKAALTDREAAAFPTFEQAKPMAKDVLPRLEFSGR